MLISIFQLIHHTLNHGKAKEREQSYLENVVCLKNIHSTNVCQILKKFKTRKGTLRGMCLWERKELKYRSI